MEIRGERECQSCGTRWSYYETGEITCPECGSARSVGVDDPTEHTAGTATLDLTSVRDNIDDVPFETLTEDVAEEAQSYLRTVGFVHAGKLQPLDDTFLAASELRRVAVTLGRVMRVEDDEKLYFLELLRVADQGDRPGPTDVPESLAPERGLAVASAVETYVADLRRVYEDPEDEVTRILSSVRSHRKRIEALDGDVDPTEAEQLVRTIRDVSEYLREDDETALARALDRL